MNEIANSILSVVELIADKKIREAGFDKTIVAEVIETPQGSTGTYTVRYQDSDIQEVLSDSNYAIKDRVYVLIPQNNDALPKRIIGKVNAADVAYDGEFQTEEDSYDIIGGDVVNSSTSFSVNYGSLIENSNSFEKILYSVNSSINEIDFSEKNFQNAIGNSTALIIKGVFAPNFNTLPPEVFDCDYGIRITMADGEDNDTSFIFNTNDMVGNPWANEDQAQFKALPIDFKKWNKVIEVVLYATNLGAEDEISVSELEIKGGNDIAAKDKRTELTIETPLGTNQTSFDRDLSLSAVFRKDGIKVTEGLGYEWYKEVPPEINGGNKWAPLEKFGNALSLDVLNGYEQNYKCIATYQGTEVPLTLEKEVTLTASISQHILSSTTTKLSNFTPVIKALIYYKAVGFAPDEQPLDSTLVTNGYRFRWFVDEVENTQLTGSQIKVSDFAKLETSRIYKGYIFKGDEYIGEVSETIPAYSNAINETKEYYYAASFDKIKGNNKLPDKGAESWVNKISETTFGEVDKYLWNYEEIIYTNSGPSTTEPSVIATWSKDGNDAVYVYAQAPNTLKRFVNENGETIGYSNSLTIEMYKRVGSEEPEKDTTNYYAKVYQDSGEPANINLNNGAVTIGIDSITATEEIQVDIYSDSARTKIIDKVAVNIVKDGDKGETGDTGPQGEKGDKGDTGPQGPQGEQGIQGIQGVQGPEGKQGIQGPTGPKGDTGDIGPKGDANYLVTIDKSEIIVETDEKGNVQSLSELTETTVSVAYGTEDVTGDCTYSWATSSGDDVLGDSSSNSTYFTTLTSPSATATCTVTLPNDETRTISFTVKKRQITMTTVQQFLLTRGITPTDKEKEDLEKKTDGLSDKDGNLVFGKWYNHEAPGTIPLVIGTDKIWLPAGTYDVNTWVDAFWNENNYIVYDFTQNLEFTSNDTNYSNIKFIVDGGDLSVYYDDTEVYYNYDYEYSVDEAWSYNNANFRTITLAEAQEVGTAFQGIAGEDTSIGLKSYRWTRTMTTITTTLGGIVVDSAPSWTEAELAESDARITEWCKIEDTAYIDGGAIYAHSIASEQMAASALRSLNYPFYKNGVYVNGETTTIKFDTPNGDTPATNNANGESFLDLEKNIFPSQGSFFDLDKGYIFTPAFKVFQEEKSGEWIGAFRGHVQAETGNIGNWQVSGGNLYAYSKTNNTKGILLSPNLTDNDNDDDTAIAVGLNPVSGDIPWNEAPLSISHSGVLTLTATPQEKMTLSIRDKFPTLRLYQENGFISELKTSGLWCLNSPANYFAPIVAQYNGAHYFQFEKSTNRWSVHDPFCIRKSPGGDPVGQICYREYPYGSGQMYFAIETDRDGENWAPILINASGNQNNRILGWWEVDGGVGFNQPIFIRNYIELGNSDYPIVEIRGQCKFTSNVYNSQDTPQFTSDRNAKNSIQDISEQYNILFDNLRPVIHKFNEGTSNRYHSGFISQEADQAREIAGLTRQDFAAVCVDNEGTEKEEWSLRYTEFIPLNTWQIQKAKARISELETKNMQLEERLARLEAALNIN